MRCAPRRGDVYWVALDPTMGTEIKKTRPAIIVSNDSCNAYGARVVVLPLTSNVSSLYPAEALLKIEGSRLALSVTDFGPLTSGVFEPALGA